jgi:hypothetical protein
VQDSLLHTSTVACGLARQSNVKLLLEYLLKIDCLREEDRLCIIAKMEEKNLQKN